MAGPAVVTLGFGYGPLRGRPVTPVLPQWPAKDPLVTSTRWMDFSCVLGTRAIVGLGVAAAGVTAAGCSWAGTVAAVRLGGGTAGTVARVELQALCDDGSSEPGVALLPITAVLSLSEGALMAVTMTTTTKGAAPGVLGPLPVFAPTGASVSLRGQLLARNTVTSDTVSWELAALVKYFGTPAAVVDGQNIIPYAPADAALSGCAAALQVQGGALSLSVTGTAGASLIWSVSLNYTVA